MGKKKKTKIMAFSPITSWQIDEGKLQIMSDFTFFGSKITADGDYSQEIQKHLLLGRKAYDKPRQGIKKQKHHFADKDLYSQIYGFSCSYVQI